MRLAFMPFARMSTIYVGTNIHGICFTATAENKENGFTAPFPVMIHQSCYVKLRTNNNEILPSMEILQVQREWHGDWHSLHRETPADPRDTWERERIISYTGQP